MGIDRDGTVPVQSNECPGQWPRNSWDMDESRVGVVAEVEGGQIEEVDNQDELSPEEMAADKQHDKPKLEQVVDYEMASNTSGCIDIVRVGGEQVPDISELEDIEDNPKKQV